MNPIVLELTDDQAYALAELIAHLGQENVKQYAKDSKECRLMCTALMDLQLALEHGGFYPRPLQSDWTSE